MSFKRLVLPVVIIVGLVVAYFAVVLNWSYSMGERAGWVQKLAKKGGSARPGRASRPWFRSPGQWQKNSSLPFKTTPWLKRSTV